MHAVKMSHPDFMVVHHAAHIQWPQYLIVITISYQVCYPATYLNTKLPIFLLYCLKLIVKMIENGG